MRWLKRLFVLTIILAGLIACGDHFRLALPFPTPGQHDLVVLIRPGAMTYAPDDSGGASGLEHNLIEAFAQELGVATRYIVAEGAEFEARLAGSDYHIAAGWLSPNSESGLQSTAPIFLTRDLLVQHEASLPLTEPSQLAGKTVHAIAGSRQAATLRRLVGEVPGLKVEEVAEGDIIDLLEQVAEQRIEFAALDDRLQDVASQFVPSLAMTLPLGPEQPIVWELGRRPNSELAARLATFVERVQLDGTLARLEERYFGHVRRLTQASVVRFLAEIRTRLPSLKRHFQAAQAATGIDWRLIAAVAYHESHWDPNATSYTNVRGIMMLTEETADRLGVTNRLDARESILAGARYINLLKDMLPGVGEPDRTWLALAAYNLGPGHFNAARSLAKQLKADPDAWFEMKRILPLLAKPKYYERLKAGRARGGEAVILVENIRSYYDILMRNEAAYQPGLLAPDRLSAAAASGSGLKLKN